MPIHQGRINILPYILFLDSMPFTRRFLSKFGICLTEESNAYSLLSYNKVFSGYRNAVGNNLFIAVIYVNRFAALEYRFGNAAV